MKTDWSELFDPKMPRWWRMQLLKEGVLMVLLPVLYAVGSALMVCLRVFVILLVLGLLYTKVMQHYPRDDTDPPGVRSGLHLYTDAKTGCQYLGTGFFSPATPRLDAQGKHICGVKP